MKGDFEPKTLDDEFTDREIERIDTVDNAIHEFLNNIVPNGKTVEWDRDLIISVAEAVWECIKDRNICTEMEFYPYREG
jgi:hypothetical protein